MAKDGSASSFCPAVPSFLECRDGAEGPPLPRRPHGAGEQSSPGLTRAPSPKQGLPGAGEPATLAHTGTHAGLRHRKPEEPLRDKEPLPGLGVACGAVSSAAKASGGGRVSLTLCSERAGGPSAQERLTDPPRRVRVAGSAPHGLCRQEPSHTALFMFLSCTL